MRVAIEYPTQGGLHSALQLLGRVWAAEQPKYSMIVEPRDAYKFIVTFAPRITIGGQS